MRLIDLVMELLSLNDENLSEMVIQNNDVQWCLSELYDILKSEAEPVRYGRWMLKERAHYFKCSLCNEPIPYKFGYSESRRYYNYCPNCGAEMRGGADNA